MGRLMWHPRSFYFPPYWCKIDVICLVSLSLVCEWSDFNPECEVFGDPDPNVEGVTV